MEFSNNGIDILEKLEGFSAVPYRDVAGNLTVGYGTETTSNETITEDTALDLLVAKTNTIVDSINSMVTVPLNQNQFDALVIFAYNVGIGALQRSTLLKLVNAQMFINASDQFLAWDHVHIHGQSFVNKGLENRRKAEQALFLTK